jgi:chromosome segregation protein
VENFPQALELWKKHDSKHTLVTEEGDVIDPLGVITGGIQHGSGAGYLSKKREIKDLELRLSSLVSELLALQKTHSETEAERGNREKSLKSIQERLVKQRLAHQGLEKDLRHATEDINRINGKIEFLTLEEEKVSGELVEADEDLALHRSQVGELEASEALLEESFSRLREKERGLKEKIELQGEQFDRSKTNLLDLKAQVSSLTSTLTLRENAVRHCKTEISKYEDAKEESIKERAILQEDSEHALTLIHELTHAFQTLQDELRKQEQTLDEERDGLRALEEKLKAAQKESNELQLSVQDLNHELSEITAAIRNLEETMMAKYAVSLPEVASHYPAHQYPEEETTAKLEKLDRAREKMMEGVNFNAEREYQEQVEKHEFYQSQAEDLNKSLHSLQEAINKINRTSRERFQSTFEKVSENFTHIVPLIYEGGKGELRLTDSDDLLETGVEIMVQPAGKSLKSITLLSGGEKALAAMSLLFALYLFKPTPFCLLDEIDSPLDDANVDRFITILRKFNTNSQFILITHNKKTMETADVLYGITMEEPGVSKIVSVRLN